jgi:hypothetical protein
MSVSGGMAVPLTVVGSKFWFEREALVFDDKPQTQAHNHLVQDVIRLIGEVVFVHLQAHMPISKVIGGSG